MITETCLLNRGIILPLFVFIILFFSTKSYLDFLVKGALINFILITAKSIHSTIITTYWIILAVSHIIDSHRKDRAQKLPDQTPDTNLLE